jgi:predicted RNA-binding Zn-ribbon protein involved in translation (DUF1610 family)
MMFMRKNEVLVKKELSKIKCPVCGRERHEVDFVRIENCKRVVNFNRCNFCYNKFSRLKSHPGTPLDVSAIVENKIYFDCKEKFFDTLKKDGRININGLSKSDSLLFVLNGDIVNVYQGDILENSADICVIWFIYHKLLKNYWGDEQRRWGNNNFKLIFKNNKKKFYE